MKSLSEMKRVEIDTSWETQQKIKEVCDWLAEFLIEKNKAYGNSALEPCRIFSTASPKEQLYVRIDDKLNWLMKGGDFPGDDTIKDLLGYLILCVVYDEMNGGE